MKVKVDPRPVFLVERYVPGLTEASLAALADRLEHAAEEIRGRGVPVSWLGSTAILGEETTFCVFRARSSKEVRSVNALAAVPYERIIEALHVEGGP